MTTWNANNKNNITLSTDLLTATPGSTSTSGVLATYGRKTGKAYFEVTLLSSVSNLNTLSHLPGVPNVVGKAAIIGVGLATNSQFLFAPEWSWGFLGSNTETYDGDGAPLSSTGDGVTGSGPLLNSVFNWTIDKNAPVAAGARVQLLYGRPCNVYSISNIQWHVDTCTGECKGIIQSYNPATGAISVLITECTPDLFSSDFEISFASSTDGDLNGFTPNLDTTPEYTIFPFVFNTLINGNVAVDVQVGTQVVGFALDYDAHTMQVNVGDGFYTQKSSLPADLLYPIFGTAMGTGVSATINFGASAFTYAIPTGYTAYDSTANPDPTLLPLRLTEEALEVLRDAKGPVRLSTMAVGVLHDADGGEVRLGTMWVEVLRSLTNSTPPVRNTVTVIG